MKTANVMGADAGRSTLVGSILVSFLNVSGLIRSLLCTIVMLATMGRSGMVQGTHVYLGNVVGKPLVFDRAPHELKGILAFLDKRLREAAQLAYQALKMVLS